MYPIVLFWLVQISDGHDIDVETLIFRMIFSFSYRSERCSFYLFVAVAMMNETRESQVKKTAETNRVLIKENKNN